MERAAQAMETWRASSQHLDDSEDANPQAEMAFYSETPTLSIHRRMKYTYVQFFGGDNW